MDSPAYPAAPTVDDSFFHHDDTPSSPFISEIQRSRVPSAENAPADAYVEDQTLDIFATPAKALRSPAKYAHDDKENIPQEQRTAQKQLASPRKTVSPRKGLIDRSESVSGSPNASFVESLSVPQSARKARTTPKKTPSKSAYGVAASLKSSRHGSVLKTAHNRYAANASPLSSTTPQAAGNVDDTCFSTFSEAQFSQSTSRQTDMLRTPRSQRVDATPHSSRKRASPSRSPSPTPRRQKTPSHSKRDETTSFLIDFTQQIEGVADYRAAAASPAKNSLRGYLDSQRSPAKFAAARPSSFATPAKPTSSIMNLLDFELPPAPTPRSIPTITLRELESLKSAHLSQLSALKATLSGREAEVDSLKRAIGDAERRAGEAQERLREETCRREQVEEEKAGWETRGQEVEQVLQSVKQEVMRSEAEREDLLRKLEEYERRVDEAEARAQRAEDRFADAVVAARGGGEGEAGGAGAAAEEQIQRLVEAQIDARLEAVSRELHAVYKEKHERKIAKLKESYKATSDRKYADFKHQLDELERQNEELQAAKDATFSGPLHDVAASSAAEAELKALVEEQKAHLTRLEIEMQTSREQQDQLMQELKQERIEKGELVAAVDEMLTLQQSEPGPAASSAMSVVEDFRKSISKPSGLRAPSGMVAPSESKIGRTGISSLARSTSGGLGKSKMLANIERMGRSGPGGVVPQER